MAKKRAVEKLAAAAALANSTKPNGDALYSHCYSINLVTGYQLSWTLDSEKSLLHCSVSALAVDNATWVGVGFRPLGRKLTPGLDLVGTGHKNNFGMEGADIVVGSLNLGVRTMYAQRYTGAPIPDNSLELIEGSTSVTYENDRVTLRFSRPLVS